MSGVTLAMSERESLAKKWTVTLVLYQPFGFGEDVAAHVMMGAISSTMNLVGEETVQLPKLSHARAQAHSSVVMTVELPEVYCIASLGHEPGSAG
jgi:hypothetical protein